MNCPYHGEQSPEYIKRELCHICPLRYTCKELHSTMSTTVDIVEKGEPEESEDDQWPERLLVSA